MPKNAYGALYFVGFFTVILLELKQFFESLPDKWLLFELVIYMIFGIMTLITIPWVYLNLPRAMDWIIIILELNLINMAFLFLVLPFSWTYLALFAFGFWGLVAGVPFQTKYMPQRERIVYITKPISKAKPKAKLHRQSQQNLPN